MFLVHEYVGPEIQINNIFEHKILIVFLSISDF